MMKLFKIEIKPGVEIDYDQYDSFAVIAPSAEAALEIADTRYIAETFRQEITDFQAVEVDLASAEAQVLVASFNAG